MRVIIYNSADDEVPLKFKHVAIIVEDGARMPIQFHGSDPDALRATAQKWWDDALARQQNKKPRGGRRRAADKMDAVEVETQGDADLDDIEDSI